MSDHVPNNMQEIPSEYDINCDLDQWIDWSLHDSIPDDSNWADAMDPVYQDAGMPDALGSLDEDPFSSSQATDAPPEHPTWKPDDNLSIKQCHPPRMNTTALLLENAIESTLKCEVRDCKHKGSFKSAYELARHKSSVHGGESAKIYICTAQGCFKGTSSWSFARSDKLTAHIKAVHNRNTVFAKCPDIDCRLEPCTLETLGVHIHRRHFVSEQGRAVLNATPCKVIKCPLWRCGKYMPAKNLLQHFQGHSIDEVTTAMPNLESDGLLVKAEASCGVAIQILCPVCKTATDCIEQFKRHVSVNHLWKVRENAAEHFKKWQACLLSRTRKEIHAEISDLTPWSRLEASAWDFKVKVVSCPACTLTVDLRDRYRVWDQPERDLLLASTHHFNLLRPDAEVIAELFPHRMQILRFWPEFVTHPVFADFDQLPESTNDDIPEQLELV